jgi:hypothetical protein
MGRVRGILMSFLNWSWMDGWMDGTYFTVSSKVVEIEDYNAIIVNLLSTHLTYLIYSIVKNNVYCAVNVDFGNAVIYDFDLGGIFSIKLH